MADIEILLVDDDPDILEIIRLDLEDDPEITVDTCRTAADAIERTRSKQYDVIVTDWRMPKMNGTELIRKLRQEGCTSRIILYSGHTIGADLRTALNGGADYIIHRRGDPDTEFSELRQEIRRAVDMKKP